MYVYSGCRAFSAHQDPQNANLTSAGRPIAKLDPVVREVLRVGIYEIGELALADHAIGVHVDVTKALGQPHLGSFVNGEPFVGRPDADIFVHVTVGDIAASVATIHWRLMIAQAC